MEVGIDESSALLK